MLQCDYRISFRSTNNHAMQRACPTGYKLIGLFRQAPKLGCFSKPKVICTKILQIYRTCVGSFRLVKYGPVKHVMQHLGKDQAI